MESRLFNFHRVYSPVPFKAAMRLMKFHPRFYVQNQDGMWFCYCRTSSNKNAVPMYCGAGVTKNDAFIDYKSKYMRGLCVSHNHPLRKIVG